MLMAGLSRITGMSPAMAGMLIAQTSYLAATLLFYKLARLIEDDHGYAIRSTVYMLLFPSSLFFFAVYAEPLSLAFSVLGVYLVMRTRPSYIWAGLSLGIASIARPVGWLFDIVLLVEFIRRRRYDLASFASLVVGGILSIAGIVAYMYYLYTLTGSWLAIPEAQSGWQAQFQFPWVTYWMSLRLILFGTNVAGDWFLYVMNVIDLGFITLALALTGVAAWRSLRHQFSWGLTIYLLISSAFLLTQQRLEVAPIWGMTRWVAALFPIYLILGNLSKRKVVQWGGAVGSGLLLLLFAAWWISGRWVG
jgi:Gpi18-like mannosyltransferase